MKYEEIFYCWFTILHKVYFYYFYKIEYYIGMVQKYFICYWV